MLHVLNIFLLTYVVANYSSENNLLLKKNKLPFLIGRLDDPSYITLFNHISFIVMLEINTLFTRPFLRDIFEYKIELFANLTNEEKFKMFKRNIENGICYDRKIHIRYFLYMEICLLNVKITRMESIVSMNVFKYLVGNSKIVYTFLGVGFTKYNEYRYGICKMYYPYSSFFTAFKLQELVLFGREVLIFDLLNYSPGRFIEYGIVRVVYFSDCTSLYVDDKEIYGFEIDIGIERRRYI